MIAAARADPAAIASAGADARAPAGAGLLIGPRWRATPLSHKEQRGVSLHDGPRGSENNLHAINGRRMFRTNDAGKEAPADAGNAPEAGAGGRWPS